MRNLIVALIYTALAATANADNSALEALKQGDMRKLRFHAVAEDVPAVPFMLEDGSNTTMEHYVGKIVVLNFWATWCAPCRKEMPHLS
ncbi:MAG: TlpA family protein disulfide reductase, partial [Planktomarina sp.]